MIARPKMHGRCGRCQPNRPGENIGSVFPGRNSRPEAAETVAGASSTALLPWDKRQNRNSGVHAGDARRRRRLPCWRV